MIQERELIIPALRVNNRNISQRFLEENLGLTVHLEEAAFAEFGDQASRQAKLVLIESPSMRTRAVKGVKKVHQIVLKATAPSEIEDLLASGAVFTKLYKGPAGYAFESLSPEGDCFLLHAENAISDLVEVLPSVAFRLSDTKPRLTAFSVEKIIINTPQLEESRAFYQKILPDQTVVDFCQADGEDLLVAADATWDLDSLRIPVADDMDWTALEECLDRAFFKDKRGRFLQTTDLSNIELWFEK